MSIASLAVDHTLMRPRGAKLQVSGVAHRFGGLKVLTDVNLEVGDGHGIVGLIGPNGSGKTTLFNIVTGFLRPNTGRILLDGDDITTKTVQQRSRAGLLRTFQAPRVFDNMSVLENVLLGAYARTRAGLLTSMLALPSARAEIEAVRASAFDICRKFGIERLAGEKAGSLPAGLRRIVELARAYHAKPRVLLLDEPSSGLSTPEIEELKAWIRVLAEEGISILLVSHDMGLMAVCDRVHVLYFGKIIATGPMSTIQENPDVQDAYLGG
ncbi:ABC transporter ATP-binding protein [Ensifer adhaerens]|uniref:ABC transporter ATP-binding protein n=1 Tax=Ensifer adhaerens TaxID=106592 RepID=UPI000FD96324|nr:ABC transporter ATP-binding protein [Ensifer adhaerens]MDF8357668.1 ABC transporter ATP-binding protein [Ensifer adhaerens]THA60188.1 ABC transporter ATP-binding protein [Ensifer adhaerens]